MNQGGPSNRPDHRQRILGKIQHWKGERSSSQRLMDPQTARCSRSKTLVVRVKTLAMRRVLPRTIWINRWALVFAPLNHRPMLIHRRSLVFVHVQAKV